jgi:hypothetical protein
MVTSSAFSKLDFHQLWYVLGYWLFQANGGLLVLGSFDTAGTF